MKKILLVNPYGTEQGGYINPPLGLLYLAGTLVKAGFEVKIADGCKIGKEAVIDVIKEYKPEVVGITCYTPGRKKVLEIAQIVKDINPEIITLLGGAHPTIMYKQILENYSQVDYIILGEGEITLLEFMQGKNPHEIDGMAFMENNKLVKTNPRKYVENLDDIPFPAWHLLDLTQYEPRGSKVYRGIDLAAEPRISVIFSRGCIGHCTFCSTWWIWRGWRRRSALNMVDELELLNRKFGIKHFCFADDAFTIDRKATIELCNEIIRRKLNIAFMGTTRTDCIDEEMLNKLHEAGCYCLTFGIETGSPRMLESINKENNIENSIKAIALTKKAGIEAIALMIVGSVGENKDTIRETVEFLRKTEPDGIGCVGGLWIMPGTKLHADCKKWGYIDDDFWLGDEEYKTYTREYSKEQLYVMFERVMNYKISDKEFYKDAAKKKWKYWRYKLLSALTLGKKSKYVQKKKLYSLWNC